MSQDEITVLFYAPYFLLPGILLGIHRSGIANIGSGMLECGQVTYFITGLKWVIGRFKSFYSLV